MNTLRLPLKRRWFEMAKAGIKTEEYREVTPYWCRRLLHYKESILTLEEIVRYVTHHKCYGYATVQSVFNYHVAFKKFDTTTLTLGYPSNSDKERIIEFENLGISIGYGKEEWGAEKYKLYFVIKHGKRVN